MPRIGGAKNNHSLAVVVEQNILLENQIVDLEQQIVDLKAGQVDLKVQQAAEFARLYAQGEALAKFLLGRGPEPK